MYRPLISSNQYLIPLVWNTFDYHFLHETVKIVIACENFDFYALNTKNKFSQEHSNQVILII